MTIDITAHAMLVNLRLGVWTGFKLDRHASATVADEAQADDKEAFRVNKRLVAKESLQPVETARNALRAHHIDRTLPWSDEGPRLLTRKIFQKYTEEQGALEQAFVNEANKFSGVYLSERERARFRLGARFNPDDYPPAEEIRAKFYCHIEISPVPSAGDFRVSLNSDALDNIKAQIERATEERIFGAQRSVWERIENTVQHFAGRMAAQMEDVEEGKRRPPLHQSTIDNFVHLVNALPALNIMGDPNMKAVGKRLHTLLTTHNDAGKMKGRPDVCAQAHEEVQDIIAEMSGFIDAFAIENE